MFTMNEKTWRDEFRGHNITRLLTPSGEPVVTFDNMDDGGCYRAFRTLDDLRKCSQVDAELFKQEVALSLLSNFSGSFPNCQLHQNVTVHKTFSEDVAQQFDGVLHGHLFKPTYAIIMDAKISIHPDHFAEVLEKVAIFKNYVSRAPAFNFSTGWGPVSDSSPFTHFSNVQYFIPCLAGRRFPENLAEECLDKGIIPVFPSGARYVTKGLGLLKKML